MKVLHFPSGATLTFGKAESPELEDKFEFALYIWADDLIEPEASDAPTASEEWEAYLNRPCKES